MRQSANEFGLNHVPTREIIAALDDSSLAQYATWDICWTAHLGFLSLSARLVAIFHTVTEVTEISG
jgi:hypothetical protein